MPHSSWDNPGMQAHRAAMAASQAGRAQMESARQAHASGMPTPRYVYVFVGFIILLFLVAVGFFIWFMVWLISQIPH